ncbi:MAG TPA: hypothetical protein VGN25_02115 [Solirubrobacteraceae bacterium]|jgi:hypothetical protein|nr:hypothetical protein [Solirubrobacteraceae bacterium]
MFSRPRKLPLLVLAVLAVFVLSACGDSHSKVSTGTYAGESGQNAPYLDVGPLKYEVQLSRELNPANSEDAAYLQGLGESERKLEPGQEWFGVFVQVYNETNNPLPSANELTITDTQGNSYIPIVPSKVNPYAYRAGVVPAKGQLPIPDATAELGPSQGALLLYKIQVVSLDNRPLELKIVDPTDSAETASAELDV